MSKPDILLRSRPGSWVEIVNNGGRSYPATIDFIERNRRYMRQVCFGDGAVPNVGVLCIELERVPAFIAYAERNGFRAEPMVV